MAMSSDYYIEQARTVELTAHEARMVLRALEPLLVVQRSRCAVGDSDLDDDQPIPQVPGCRLGHLRAAWWGARALKRALGDER